MDERLSAAAARLSNLAWQLGLKEKAAAAQRVYERADKEFNEADHPRAEDGRFGNKAGAHGSEEKPSGGEAGEKTAKKSASGRESHWVAPSKFSAHDYAQKHDDPHASRESVLKHFPPDVADQIREYEAKAKERGQTIDRYRDADGKYEPKRKALHESIIKNVLSPERIKAATPKPGEKPTFTILGGRGGSGKSWFEGKVYDPDKAILLDADAIKKMLPEYEGWNAAEVHEESGDIFDDITEFCAKNGLNLVHDATMKTPAKATKLVEGFKERGYHISAHYMHLSRQEAAKRAVERFLGKTRRLVPPEVVLSNVKNESAFDDVKKLADRWSFRDNNVPKGDPPKLISESADG
jgi:predicted ABC-type ATPase